MFIQDLNDFNLRMISIRQLTHVSTTQYLQHQFAKKTTPYVAFIERSNDCSLIGIGSIKLFYIVYILPLVQILLFNNSWN